MLPLELEGAGCRRRAKMPCSKEHDGRWSIQGDPTEGALIVAARKVGLHDAALGARFKRVGEVPFSSERKLMSTIHEDAGTRRAAGSIHQRAHPTSYWPAVRKNWWAISRGR